jgi:REP element-mobilizing transposase RayT
MQQLNLPMPSRRGGARRGAGRKRSPPHQRRTPHRERPVHRANQPVHITLRAGIRSLRHQHVARTVLGAFRASNREHFRIVHYSVQQNHVHLIVEASNKAALSTGVRGLMVRVARRVNRLLFRRGRFWADRWHGHALTSPREVRNALVYVYRTTENMPPRALGPRSTRSLRHSGSKASRSRFRARFAAWGRQVSSPRARGYCVSVGSGAAAFSAGRRRKGWCLDGEELMVTRDPWRGPAFGVVVRGGCGRWLGPHGCHPL